MIPLFKVFMHESAANNVSNVLNSGMITQASKVDEFEKQLKEWFNYPYILSVNSATSGLTLACKMLDLQDGDEVLSCPLTCTATNWPILTNRLEIKWVDVDQNTCNMSLADLESKISEKTRAIMLVHWAGIPNDMDKINDIVKCAEAKFNTKIRIIEDCAHAFGSKYKDKFIGTTGNFAVFSLQAIKHLTTGDGGLLFCPTLEDYERAKLLRWFGVDRNFRSTGNDFRLEPDVKEYGYKYHMNDINASIGLSNLPHMIEVLSKHRKNAQTYISQLSYCKHVKMLDMPKDCLPSWWIFTFKIKDRDSFIDFAKQKGFVASQVHKRNDVHSCVAKYKTHLPQLDVFEKEYISIPVGWWLEDTQVNYIIDCLKKWEMICSFNITIRNLCPDDYDRGYLDLYLQLGNGIDLKHLTKEEFVLKITNEYFVAEHDGNIVGCGKFIKENKMYKPVAHVEDVIVDKTYRRLGVGSKLIKHFVNLAKKEQCYKIVLAAQEINSKFYESNGFMSNNKEWKILL